MYEHDDAGRLVASRPEVEWDDEQRALVAAFAEVEDDTCPHCGNPMSECMSPDSDPDNRDGTHRYVASAPHRCFAATAREIRADGHKDAPQRHALSFPVRREERTPRT